MKDKVTRMYKDEIKVKSKIKVLNQNVLEANLKDNSIDTIISSPPYYNTIDYVHANRLRLWFSGVDFDQQKLSRELIQDRYTYEEEQKLAGSFINV